jgi:hypothetical protein
MGVSCVSRQLCRRYFRSQILWRKEEKRLKFFRVCTILRREKRMRQRYKCPNVAENKVSVFFFWVSGVEDLGIWSFQQTFHFLTTGWMNIWVFVGPCVNLAVEVVSKKWGSGCLTSIYRFLPDRHKALLLRYPASFTMKFSIVTFTGKSGNLHFCTRPNSDSGFIALNINNKR